MNKKIEELNHNFVQYIYINIILRAYSIYSKTKGANSQQEYTIIKVYLAITYNLLLIFYCFK